MSGHSLVEVLASCSNLEQLVDPTVERAACETAGRQVSTLELAGASLGNAYEAVSRLVATGILPDQLSAELKDDLTRRLRIETISGHILKSHTADVAAWLGLPAGVALHGPSIPDRATAYRPLFLHQRRALRDLRKLLEAGNTRVLIHMPTGAGKTRTTMGFVCEWLRQHEEGAVLWVASTSELCEQAALEFVHSWQLLGNRDVPVLKAWGGTTWDPEEVNDGMVVITPQTLHSRKINEGAEYISRLGRRVTLIVFDEAHQAIAPTYRTAVDQLASTGHGLSITPIIGLSATPGRTLLGGDQDEALAEFFHHNKVKLDTSASGQSNPVRHLIEQGYLAEAEFELLRPEAGLSSDVVMGANFDIDDWVESTLEPEEYLIVVGSAVHELIARGHRRILAFVASVRLCDQLAAVLRATGVRAECINGETPGDIRAGMIARYKSDGDSPRVLVNFGVLTTGFDAPTTSAAVIARPTRSLVLYSQMVGRAIRGPKAGGNATATIVTVVDPAVPAFGDIAEAFSHWEDLWDE